MSSRDKQYIYISLNGHIDFLHTAQLIQDTV